jgi:hypothetical protein
MLDVVAVIENEVGRLMKASVICRDQRSVPRLM